LPSAEKEVDIATVIGLVASLGLIIIAILLGQSYANFFNLPSVLIVILGTLAVTMISYTQDELSKAWLTIKESAVRAPLSISEMARVMIDFSILAKRRGLLHLSTYEDRLQSEPFLSKSLRLVTDHFDAKDIEHFLQNDIETSMERHKKSASILRRASEIAPGMGLIGTLVGLVQMLSQLDDPSSIGPAMAVALLTTFYGAIMGTVVLAPLAAKIERNGQEEAIYRTTIMAGAASIARQENPRRLEIILNSVLPPSARIEYFKS
jgi:chemotaxis protein MotA